MTGHPDDLRVVGLLAGDRRPRIEGDACFATGDALEPPSQSADARHDSQALFGGSIHAPDDPAGQRGDRQPDAGEWLLEQVHREPPLPQVAVEGLDIAGYAAHGGEISDRDEGDGW